jgi:hypothetical protein
VTDSQGIYQQGTAVTLDAQFVVDTTPTDPTTVTFNIRAPDDTLVSYVFGVDVNVTNPGVGHYVCKLDPPALPRQYYYNAVGTGAVEAVLPGEFYVVPSSVIPPPASVGPQMPPCTTWIDGEDLALCAQAADTDPGVLDGVAVMASMLMFELSGRQFNGICGPVTVRPCREGGCSAGLAGWGSWQWSWGYWSGDWGYGWFWGNEDGGRLCSCGYDSKVEIAGYPVTEIVEVKIDGQVVAPTFPSGAPAYRLDEWRFLTRLSDPADPSNPLFWPLCQRLDLQDDQPGTWSVKYIYGAPPPPLGIEAAKQIGCQLLNAVSGKPCQLPSNATKLVKQGTTIERVTPLATILRAGGTGLVMVDAFIAAYNPSGLKRRPAVMSPDLPFPIRVGAE